MYDACGIGKTFGGVRALDGIDLTVHPGEVQALLGANGAGKSTLVKILVGAEKPDEGSLTLDGAPVTFRSSADAAAVGVAIVSQELTVFPDLDVLANLFLLREPCRAGLVDRRTMAGRARPVLDTIGLDVALDRPARSLRLAEQQLLEIARSLLMEPKVLFLDEPTSALGPVDTRRLLDVVRRLRASGVAVVYVSHFLEDVFAIADTVSVLRNGRMQVHRRRAAEMTVSGTVTEMLGEAGVREQAPRPSLPAGPGEDDGRLDLAAVTIAGTLAPLDLAVGRGEVVGLAGLEGSGAAAVLDVVFGNRRPDSGTVTLPDGRPGPRSVTRAVRAGIARIPADRKRQGLMLDRAIQDNITAVAAGPLGRMGPLLRDGAAAGVTERWRTRLGIAMSGPRAPVGQLSGGNQQKVVFAKWLETDPAVVLLDDPTRGVDVGARAEMHAVIRGLAERRRVVLLTSSDLDELAAVCGRVVVFFQGVAVGELSGDHLNEHELLEAVHTGRLPADGPSASVGAREGTR